MADIVHLWAAGGLYVDVQRDNDGGFTILGQHLSPAGEYEYALTVVADDVPAVVDALGGEPGSDVVAGLRLHADTIVRTGELTWLRSIGVEPDFWSRGEY